MVTCVQYMYVHDRWIYGSLDLYSTHMGDSVVMDVTFAQKTPNSTVYVLQICNQGLLE